MIFFTKMHFQSSNFFSHSELPSSLSKDLPPSKCFFKMAILVERSCSSRASSMLFHKGIHQIISCLCVDVSLMSHIQPHSGIRVETSCDIGLTLLSKLYITFTLVEPGLKKRALHLPIWLSTLRWRVYSSQLSPNTHPCKQYSTYKQVGIVGGIREWSLYMKGVGQKRTWWG